MFATIANQCQIISAESVKCKQKRPLFPVPILLVFIPTLYHESIKVSFDAITHKGLKNKQTKKKHVSRKKKKQHLLIWEASRNETQYGSFRM